MDKEMSAARAQLLEAADLGRNLADTVELEGLLDEGRRRRAARRRHHQLGVVALVVVVTIAAITIPITLAGRGSKTATVTATSVPVPGSTAPPLGADGLPIGSLTNWSLVAPEGAGGQTNASGHFDVYNLATGAETTRAVDLRGLAEYPWLTVGQFLVGIANIPLSGLHSTGEAFALNGANGKMVPLGRANEVWAAAQPRAVWLETDAVRSSVRSACAVREVTVTGASLGAVDAVSCDRFIAGAVDGGLLSAREASRDLTLQIWDPATGRVARTLARGVGLVVATSPSDVLWEADSTALYLTDVLTGRTTRVAVPVQKGYIAWGAPVLASSGPLVAMLMVTPATRRMIERPGGAGGACCSEYSVSGSGLLTIYNVTTRHVVMTRAVPLSTVANLKWTSDDSFVVLNTGDSGVAAVPTWSTSAPATQIATSGSGAFVDNQNDTVVRR